LGNKDNRGQYHYDSYYNTGNLLGGSVKMGVRLDGMQCGCNAALSMVAAPGYNMDGLPVSNNLGTYYCDANAIGGLYCPELDLMEANKYAFKLTAHKCSDPRNKYYDSCDKVGCAASVWESDPKAYGPGYDTIINTDYPFDVTFKFNTDTSGNELTGIDVVFGQSCPYGACWKTYVMHLNNTNKCSSGYLKAMSEPLK